MARNNRHNVAFVVGSVLGAVAGAAAALWKTPYSGEELRAKLGVGGGGNEASTTKRVTIASSGERSMKDKVLSGVEKTLAPIVGVELGKTADGSGAASGSTIKVNADVAGTGHATDATTAGTTGGSDVSLTHAADGSEMIGLSRDKVDADKWAAAYAGTDTGRSASGSTSTTPTTSSSTSTASAQPSSLRHQHSWRGDASGSTEDVSVTHAADGSTMIGLSRDKVDADKWAAAYAGEDLDKTGSTSSSSSTSTRSSSFGGGSSSKAEESSRKTGLGASPAYPGDDQPGHAPANNTAPDSSVGEVSGGADNRANRNRQASTDEVRPDLEAASIDQLTTPQVQVQPEAAPGVQHEMHPFPKLGGKERN